MLLEFESRHGVVGLRLEISTKHPVLGRRVEEGQPPSGDQIMHERGNEHGLAGTSQPRRPASQFNQENYLQRPKTETY